MPTTEVVLVDEVPCQVPRTSPFEIETTVPVMRGQRILGVGADSISQIPMYDPWAALDYEGIVRSAFARVE